MVTFRAFLSMGNVFEDSGTSQSPENSALYSEFILLDSMYSIVELQG